MQCSRRTARTSSATPSPPPTEGIRSTSRSWPPTRASCCATSTWPCPSIAASPPRGPPGVTRMARRLRWTRGTSTAGSLLPQILQPLQGLPQGLLLQPPQGLLLQPPHRLFPPLQQQHLAPPLQQHLAA